MAKRKAAIPKSDGNGGVEKAQSVAIKQAEYTDEELHKIFDEAKINKDTILIPRVYREVFNPDSKYRYFLLSSGRISGKTSILVASWWLYSNKYPDRDIVILQATATEIKDSIINEIAKFLVNSGYDVAETPTAEFYIPRAHDRIERAGYRGRTLFYPITDSSGGQRSRGVNTTNKLSLVLFEEAQKNRDRDVLNQAVITFIRQFGNDPDSRLVVVGNNETVGHWFVDYVNEKKQDPEWCYIYANCYDIWNLLDDRVKSFIDSERKANEIEFKRVFLGDINASTSDVVFPQFVRSKCYKRDYELEKHYFMNLIIGIDHATANDTFAVVPVAILDNGTTQTLEVCYDDPEQTNRTLAPTEQCAILEDFIEFLDNKYGIEYNHINVILSVDGAASPFIAQLAHLKKTARNKRLWKNIHVKAFTLKHKDVNLGIIKNAFAYGVLTILNEGWKDWRGMINQHRLANELEKQRYRNGKLDDRIKNDLCDALEYGLIPFYNNCYNLSFPVRKAVADAHYDDIRKMARIIS